MQSFLYTLSGTNQPAQLTGVGQFTQATFRPVKGFSTSGTPSGNVNPVYIGMKSGECAIALASGNPVTIDTSTTQVNYDVFSNWWAVGTAGDGVYVSYI
jgi:hypothetical protein